MAKSVNEYLEALAPWVDDWALMTQAEREIRRRDSSGEALQAFYDAMVPLMGGIVETLNQYPINDLPPDARRLMNLTLSLAEIAPHVEFYACASGVPFAFEEDRFVAERAHWTSL